MQSYLTIQVIATLIKFLNFSQFHHFTAFPINLVSAKLFNLPEGKILLHSLSSYFFNLDLFECNLTKDTRLNVLIEKSSFFMFAVLKGRSIFSDKNGNPISETAGNSAALSYLSKGRYQWQLCAGQHHMLCITFREDYFIRKSLSLPIIQPLVKAYQNASLPYLVLPNCAIGNSIFKLVDKQLGRNMEPKDVDMATHIFIDKLLNNYVESLNARQYDTHTIHKQKINEIINYIHRHYAEKNVGDLSMLANRFNLSERSLLRLIKESLHMPLCEYIIKFRMNIAFTKLSASKRPVKEIAAEVGYSDPLYFSKVFKKYHKMNPSDVHGKNLQNDAKKHMENSCI